VVQWLSRNPKDLALFSRSGTAHPSQLLAACASETACAPQPPNSSDSLGSFAPQINLEDSSPWILFYSLFASGLHRIRFPDFQTLRQTTYLQDAVMRDVLIHAYDQIDLEEV
jgi:hypothetical protein